MMDGTLAAKDEISVLREALAAPPAWLASVAPEKRNAEQRAAVEALDAKAARLAELVERHRLALRAELARLAAEVKALADGFDATVAALAARRAVLAASIEATELYATALLVAVVDRDVNAKAGDSIIAAAEALLVEEEAAIGALARARGSCAPAGPRARGG
jgi:hypothetical protein